MGVKLEFVGQCHGVKDNHLLASHSNSLIEHNNQLINGFCCFDAGVAATMEEIKSLASIVHQQHKRSFELKIRRKKKTFPIFRPLSFHNFFHRKLCTTHRRDFSFYTFDCIQFKKCRYFLSNVCWSSKSSSFLRENETNENNFLNKFERKSRKKTKTQMSRAAKNSISLYANLQCNGIRDWRLRQTANVLGKGKMPFNENTRGFISLATDTRQTSPFLHDAATGILNLTRVRRFFFHCLSNRAQFHWQINLTVKQWTCKRHCLPNYDLFYVECLERVEYQHKKKIGIETNSLDTWNSIDFQVFRRSLVWVMHSKLACMARGW